MLSVPAGGGVGLEQNIVAFNNLCFHQRGPLEGQFQGHLGVADPLPAAIASQVAGTKRIHGQSVAKAAHKPRKMRWNQELRVAKPPNNWG